MFGAAQTNSLGSHFSGLARVLGGVCVGPHPELANPVRPAQQRGEGLRQPGSREFCLPPKDQTLISIEREPVALVDELSIRRRRLCCIINLQLATADDAALPPNARNHGGVAGLAPGGGHNSLSGEHSANVLRTGFAAD